MQGKGGSCGVSANEYSCAHGTKYQINFGDLTQYLTYAFSACVPVFLAKCFIGYSFSILKVGGSTPLVFTFYFYII
jgi:hypothetical protein